jgi:hypothetical protein
MDGLKSQFKRLKSGRGIHSTDLRGRLGEEERWALAFHVANLGVPAERTREGERLWRAGEARKIFPDLANVATLMEAAGGSLSDVIMLRLYIAESARDEQQPIAEALRKHFPTNPPPSSWIIVRGLSEPEWLIEIEAEAVIP